MHLHALNQAITLYRGETLTIEQAARHAGVTAARMETALRSRGVPVRGVPDSPTPTGANAPDSTPSTTAPTPGPGGETDTDPFGDSNPAADAD